MGKQRNIFIGIETTTRCNRHCRHCSFDSTEEGVDFTSRKTEKLISHIEKNNLRSNICLSGGGEPLMNPQLPDIAKIISDSPLTEELHLVTSGLRNNTEEKRLEKVIQNVDHEKFLLHLSFHIYSPGFLKRFESTVKFLLESRLNYFHIKATVGKKRPEGPLDAVHKHLEDVFEKLGIRLFIIEPGNWTCFHTQLFSRTIYNEEFKGLLEDMAFWPLCWYAHFSKRKAILVKSQALYQEGRAKKLGNLAFPYNQSYYCPTIFQKKTASLHLDVMGNFYPAGDCLPKTYPHMTIGTVDDKFKGVLKRQGLLADKMLRLILTDKRMYDKKNNICFLCSRIKAEQFA